MEDVYKMLRPNEWQNMEEVREDLKQRDFWKIDNDITMEWAKCSSENRINLIVYFKNFIEKEKLIRVQWYFLVSIISDILFAHGFMDDFFIDSTMDSLYSSITGDCSIEDVLTFPDDPPNENVRWHADGNIWKLNTTWKTKIS
jgi:hypothetical protein